MISELSLATSVPAIPIARPISAYKTAMKEILLANMVVSFEGKTATP